MLNSGKRFRDLPLDLVIRTIACWDKPNFKYIAVHQLAYGCWLDKGEPEEARRHLNEIIKHREQFPLGMQPSLWELPAFFAAFYDRDLEQAKEFRSRFIPNVFSQTANQHLLTAAIEVLEGDVAAARQAIELTRSAMPDLTYEGQRPFIEDFLLELESRCDDFGH